MCGRKSKVASRGSAEASPRQKKIEMSWNVPEGVRIKIPATRFSRACGHCARGFGVERLTSPLAHYRCKSRLPLGQVKSIQSVENQRSVTLQSTGLMPRAIQTIFFSCKNVVLFLVSQRRTLHQELRRFWGGVFQ